MRRRKEKKRHVHAEYAEKKKKKRKGMFTRSGRCSQARLSWDRGRLARICKA